jgi:hypothetical protein
MNSAADVTMRKNDAYHAWPEEDQVPLGIFSTVHSQEGFLK